MAVQSWLVSVIAIGLNPFSLSLRPRQRLVVVVDRTLIATGTLPIHAVVDTASISRRLCIL